MSDTSLYDVKHPKTKFYEGLEIGAVSVKWVRRTSAGETLSEVIRHEGSPQRKIQELFKKHNVDGNSKIVITGQATASFLNLPYFSEIECLEKALSYYNLKPDILLSLGGETFSVYPMKNGVIKNIISTSRCAAGTGEFIVQQLQRMGLSIEDGIKASSQGNYTQLATRCSVHCKSDATHRLNKGECTPSDIAMTLIRDLARKVSEMIDLAQWPKDLIVLSGGVARNKVFIENLRNFLSDSEIKILPESPYLEVFGASIFASELTETIIREESWIESSKVAFETHEPLFKAESLLDYRVNLKSKLEIKAGENYILGIDAGSTTTKAVLFNVTRGTVGASAYLRTLGNPILATKQCIDQLIDQVGENSIKII
ncbi:MAG: BadF/BadG/BcrA/BcrD ATPase family protein, partial [Promethearchaeota archaeon]